MLGNNPACSYYIYLKDREEKDTPEHPNSNSDASRSEQGSRADPEQQQCRLQCKRSPPPAARRGRLTFAKCRRRLSGCPESLWRKGVWPDLIPPDEPRSSPSAVGSAWRVPAGQRRRCWLNTAARLKAPAWVWALVLLLGEKNSAFLGDCKPQEGREGKPRGWSWGGSCTAAGTALSPRHGNAASRRRHVPMCSLIRNTGPPSTGTGFPKACAENTPGTGVPLAARTWLAGALGSEGRRKRTEQTTV